MRHQNHDFTLPFTENIYNEGLIQIEDKLLELNDKHLTEIGLPPSNRLNNNPLKATLKRPYDSNQLNAYIEENYPKLVPDQHQAFNMILDSVEHNKGKIFFINAPGGTGKTFLTNLILAKVRSSGKMACEDYLDAFADRMSNER